MLLSNISPSKKIQLSERARKNNDDGPVIPTVLSDIMKAIKKIIKRKIILQHKQIESVFKSSKFLF